MQIRINMHLVFAPDMGDRRLLLPERQMPKGEGRVLGACDRCCLLVAIQLEIQNLIIELVSWLVPV